MKITNNYNLPAPLVSALSVDRVPRPNTLSVTEIIQPPQLLVLARDHESELEEDASERIWKVMGDSVHYILQHSEGEGQREQDLAIAVVVNGLKWVVTGRPDLLEQKTLWDYKVTSVWTVINQGVKKEWEEQLNCYAALYLAEGFVVSDLKICAILRDWVISKAGESNYPPCAAKVLDVPMWGSTDAFSFIEKRLKLHIDNMTRVESELTKCTEEDRWYRPGKYAVMKKGRKSAIKLFDDFDAAGSFAKALNEKEKTNGYFVLIRRGKSARCWDYCPVNDFCYQFKTEIAPNEGGEDDE